MAGTERAQVVICYYERPLMKTLLFLCTGNFYRSRFAELYFRHLCAANSLEWIVDSRGLALEPQNIGVLPVVSDTLNKHNHEGVRLRVAASQVCYCHLLRQTENLATLKCCEFLRYQEWGANCRNGDHRSQQTGHQKHATKSSHLLTPCKVRTDRHNRQSDGNDDCTSTAQVTEKRCSVAGIAMGASRTGLRDEMCHWRCR